MLLRRSICLLLSLGSLLGVSAAAAEVESGTSYCFSAADFSREENLTGICITDLPKAEGVLCLGSRILQPGDILTAEQISQMTFSPVGTETDREEEKDNSEETLLTLFFFEIS